MPTDQRSNILGVFPLITEFLADTGIGYLVILLLYPFLDFLIVDVVSFDYSDLITIFYLSWGPLKELGYVSIIIAFIVGIASRESTWLVVSLLRRLKIEHGFARLAYRTLQWEVGKEIFKFKKAKENLIDRNPFWQVGDKDYAEFRAILVSEEGELQKFRKHWTHEEFLWLQFRRLYGFGLTFLLVYCVYGIFVICCLLYMGKPLEITYVLVWAAILVIASFITFSFYRGYIFHGVAFVTINEVSFEKFKNLKREENTSEQSKEVQKEDTKKNS